MKTDIQRTVIDEGHAYMKGSYRRCDRLRELCLATHTVGEGKVVVSWQEVVDLGRVCRGYSVPRPQVRKRRMVTSGLC